MATIYTLYDWQFDSVRWAHDLNQQSDRDKIAALELAGITASAWWAWLNPRPGKPFQHPNMSNFLNICNLLDLNPTNYFCLKIPENTDGQQ